MVICWVLRESGDAGNGTLTADREEAKRHGVSPHSCFGHIVPDYPRLVTKGLLGIRAHAEAQKSGAQTAEENAFLDSGNTEINRAEDKNKHNVIPDTKDTSDIIKIHG